MCSILMICFVFLTIAVAEESVWETLKVPTGVDMRVCQEIVDGPVREPTFRCPSKSSDVSYNEPLVCIKRSQFCDKTRDCPDGSDENLTKCMFMTLTENYILSFRKAMSQLMEKIHEKRDAEKSGRLRSSNF